MLRTEKEINDFLFAAGITKEERADLIQAALLLSEEDRLNFLIRAAGNAETAADSEYFQREEDEELWREVKKLEFNDRAALLLPNFSSSFSRSEAALEKLQLNMEERLGYALTMAQLERMVQMMVEEVKKRPHEILRVQDLDPEPEEETY